MPKTNMSGFVQTVLGPIHSEVLGPTLTHEHLLIDFTVMFKQPLKATDRFKALQPVSMQNLGWVRYDPFRNKDNLELLNEQDTISEVLLLKQSGGNGLVDATTFGIGRDPMALARISRATNLNIIMGAGYYVDAVHPHDMDIKSVISLAETIIGEITVGVDDTMVKAGIIGEIGCSWPLTKNEHKVLKASALAQLETGTSILIHPGRNEKAPFEILEILANSGADLTRVIMGHLERTIYDTPSLLKLAKSGCCLEFDLFGWETSYYPLSDNDMVNDTRRIELINILIDNGYVDKITLGHDVFSKHRLAKYGGHGYSHIMNNIVPRMSKSGISENDIQTILVKNPARLLTVL